MVWRYGDLKKKWELKKILSDNQKNGGTRKKLLYIFLPHKNNQEFIEGIEAFQNRNDFDWMNNDKLKLIWSGVPIEMFMIENKETQCNRGGYYIFISFELIRFLSRYIYQEIFVIFHNEMLKSQVSIEWFSRCLTTDGMKPSMMMYSTENYIAH
jgi:type VI protein secretion system component VasA